jgi:His-Xaa-Ser system radical SAM maturase HxsB
MKKSAFPPIDKDKLLPLRFRRLGERVLVTGEDGAFALLGKEDFERFLKGKLRSGPAYRELVRAGLVRDPTAEQKIVDRLQRRCQHITQGPSLHIVILTLRCNQACVYCHASRKSPNARGLDMSLETARRVLDVIFQSPSPSLTIEFQGGEPTLNFEVLRFMVEDAYRRNEAARRELYFSLVSNLSTLHEAQIDFLIDNGVMVCTSIDGPAPLHDRNRRLPNRSAYRETRRVMDLFAEGYRRRGLDPSLAFVNALATISRSALEQPEALVDEYVALGQKAVHLRPLNPFGMGYRIWQREGYSAQEFLAFYRRALDQMIQLNRRGVEIMEKTASLMLTRILTDENPNYMDLRSPCGAAIGQLAYNFDGRVYTCDEGRMVGAMGDDIFCIGNVRTDDYGAIIRHPGVHAMCVSSCLEGLPGCSDCAYAPYCGVCPVYNYIMEGDLVARAPLNDRCRIQMGIFDTLFERMQDAAVRKLLKKWTENRDRSSVYRRLILQGQVSKNSRASSSKALSAARAQSRRGSRKKASRARK